MRYLLALLAVPALLFPSRLHAQSSWAVSRTNLAGVTGAASVAYGNGRFVVTLAGTASAPTAAWSTDGATWNASQAQFPQSGSIIFVAGSFYLSAGSGVYRSADGNSWQQIYAAANGRGLGRIFSDGHTLLTCYSFVSGAPHALLYSADRVSFRETAAIPDSGSAYRNTSIAQIAYVNGRYFIKSFAVLQNGDGRDFYYASADGTTWTTLTGLGGPSYLTSGNGRLVGDGVVSTDGVTFVRNVYPADAFNGGAMGFAGGRFFFLGGLYASTDGVSWARIATPPAASPGRNIQSIAYGNGRYVAVGTDGVFTPTFAQFDAILTVVASATPVIATPPLDRTAVDGTSTTFAVTVENPGSGLTYQWRRDGINLPGATNAAYTIATVKPADAGAYSVELRNTVGVTVSDAAVLTVAPASTAPSISAAPAALSVIAGRAATLAVTVAGTPPFVYQWFRNDAPIVGATNSTLSFDSAAVADAGRYTVSITNSVGTVTSQPAVLAVAPADFGRLVNLSIFTTIAPGESFDVGTVVGGTGSSGQKPVLVRAMGPTLGAAPFAIPGVVADPKLEIFTGGAVLNTTNDNWGGAANLATASVQVGAFSFSSPNSKDAAVLFTANVSIAATAFTARVSDVTLAGGLVLAEFYDSTSPEAYTTKTPHLINLSVLKPIRANLAAGFVIGGSNSITVLIRAIGPTLATAFGVGGAIEDPKLEVLDSAKVIVAANDNWGGTAALSNAFGQVGAFSLPANSKDAAVLVTLKPGNYNVQVTPASGVSGLGLVEIYEVP